VTTIAGPNPRFIRNHGMGIDDANHVVGFSPVNAAETGFFYRNGKFSTFFNLAIYGINNRGQIAGELPAGRAHFSAFLTKLGALSSSASEVDRRSSKDVEEGEVL
jgi:hypothetical protein